MRKVERFKNDIMIDGVLVYQEDMTVKDVAENNWVKIEPKYYIDKSDDMIYEIWYNRTGIILDRGLNTYIENDEIANDWHIKSLKEIYKESAMIKYKERLLRENLERGMINVDLKSSSYNNKDLMVRKNIDIKVSDLKPTRCNAEPIKQQNNGGSSDWYLLPDNARTLQDLIEHRNMNGAVKDVFKACYRLGIKTEDELRDANKMAYYSLREVGRITGRKDYITIAKELMGSQAIEEYCTCEECNGKCNGDCMI